MKINYTGNFKSTLFFESIVFLIIYVFLVQSCLWIILPIHSPGYFSSSYFFSRDFYSWETSLKGERKGILSDLIEASHDAIALFFPSKAFAGPSCGSKIPIDEQSYKSKYITTRNVSIHYNPYDSWHYNSWRYNPRHYNPWGRFPPNYPLYPSNQTPYPSLLISNNTFRQPSQPFNQSQSVAKPPDYSSLREIPTLHNSFIYNGFPAIYSGFPSQPYSYNLLSNISHYNLLPNPSQHNNKEAASNNPPVAQFTAAQVDQFTDNTTGKAGIAFSFDASMSNDSDGTIVSYQWDFGDDTTAAGILLTHIFDSTGDYNVSLTVTDNDGATDKITKTVSVAEAINHPPVITTIPITNGTENIEYTYKFEATDPDRDTLTYLLSLSPVGMTINPASGLIQWTPTREQTGAQNIEVLVEDSRGESDTQQYIIQVIQTTTIVPNCICLTQTDAQNVITSAILEVGTIDVTYNETVPEGSVISQDPIAGSIVLLNNPVDLILSLGLADIDLEPTSMDTTHVIVDSQTLEITGSVDVVIQNNGKSHVIDSYLLSLFEDINTNNSLDPETDNILGTLTIIGYPLAHSQITVTVDISGSMLFKGNLIYAFVDPADKIMEKDNQNNITHSMADCESRPPVGSFNPVLEWEWTQSPINPSSDQVMCAPVVANLNDDNSDGVIDENDIPDIIFNTFAGSQYNKNGTLGAISGDGSGELFSVTDHETVPGCNPAVGDIDNDGLVEIIVIGCSPLQILAFENDGSFKWKSDSFNIIHNVAFSTINIADIDHNATPEIIIQNIVLNSDGTTRWIGSLGRTGNAVAADINLDGHTEVIAGNTLYDSNGSVIWHNESIGEAFVAIADFDDEPYPEIVLVDEGNVYLLEHTGHIIWGPIDLPPPGRSNDHGGPPTIADFDNDKEAEIGIAGGYKYTVFESDGTVKWTSPTQDRSSNRTGSSVFDFEGDGSAEVIYSDEENLLIYRGTDGAIIFQTSIGSGTLLELPIIVDVDNDNNAEIVVVSNSYCTGDKTGIQVFGDLNDTWINTRKIWNQHSYHITNVNDDGTIPLYEANNWEIYNNFR